ncbi:unnamed protein product [Effrenium voratum]|uniref:Methylenetetrahydrofolate reductase (NAD(P)H) n=1 Tax=Effrenium voratum TaxID=2562239 RepID=A0AA36J6U3_9DINO|nr:unnamed protein product [Effrenium voratum]
MAVADDKKISELVAQLPPGWFSFEYFPPKTPEGVENLRKRIVKMKALGPLFTDFTWGAGGSTSELTLKLTSAAKNEFGCVANMHLTCTNQSSEMTGNALKDCKAHGVRNIVALRGDPPRGQEKWTATEGGFSSALDLVHFIRKNHQDYFSISVAGYPEGHPDNIEEVPSFDSLTASEKRRARIAKSEGKEVITVCKDANFHKEMVYLKEKVDAGAEFVITQMFLDPEVFLDFQKECLKYDIKVPIVPGIMCLNTYGGLVRMTELCKTRVPAGLMERAEKANTSDEAFKQFGIQERGGAVQGSAGGRSPRPPFLYAEPGKGGRGHPERSGEDHRGPGQSLLPGGGRRQVHGLRPGHHHRHQGQCAPGAAGEPAPAAGGPGDVRPGAAGGKARQTRCVELIASENFTSRAVMESAWAAPSPTSTPRASQGPATTEATRSSTRWRTCARSAL